MTVFISHAAADGDAAEALEKFLERRGQFVELDDGEMALRPLQRSDVLVLCLSQNLVMSLHRLRLQQRALDAWAAGRLILVKLDHAFAPVGLRDLPAIDASFEQKREFTWNEVAQKIQGALRAPVAPPEEGEADDDLPDVPLERPRAAKVAKKGGGFGRGLLLFVLMLPGFGALWVATAIWLANRIGPTPGTFGDLLEGVDAFGRRYGAPADLTPIAFGVAIGLTALCLLLGIAGLFAPREEEPIVIARAPAPASAAPIATSYAVFVSYARANEALVLPVIEGAKHAGKHFWLDQQGLKPGDSWAGEIVRAIKGAPKVLIMCSKAAFESDHVKREIYLADRYKKRMLPVFVEAAEPPEDFEYFFAGVQFLKLFETPEAERAAALLKVLEAA